MPPRRPFMSSVKKTRSCWIWTGSIAKKSGYGYFTGNLAHRFSWQLFNGKIPEALCVLHKCDIRNCVRPEHLFLGTQKDNTQDCWNKKRHHWILNNPSKKGQLHVLAKLSNPDVIEILQSKDRNYLLAKRFGVTPAHIGNIKHGRTWSHMSSDKNT